MRHYRFIRHAVSGVVGLSGMILVSLPAHAGLVQLFQIEDETVFVLTFPELTGACGMTGTDPCVTSDFAPVGEDIEGLEFTSAVWTINPVDWLLNLELQIDVPEEDVQSVIWMENSVGFFCNSDFLPSGVDLKAACESPESFPDFILPISAASVEVSEPLTGLVFLTGLAGLWGRRHRRAGERSGASG